MRSGNGMTISGANSCLTFKTKKMMKKILFMVAAVAALAMVSCNKEGADGGTEAKEPSVVVEFSASISMGDENTAVQPQSSAATRTTVDHTVLTNPKTLWLETDEISINSVKFKVKELTNGGASAVFVNAENLPDNFGAPYKAVYPYAAEGKITLPATQTAIAGHFPKNAVCAAAYSNDAVLKFKNVASVLMFQVAAECETVTISSDNALAGTVPMTPAGDDAVPTFGEGTEKTVTINGPFATGKDYYVAVLPGTKKNFAVRIDGYLSKKANSVTINRSLIANMKTLPEPLKKVYVKNDLKWTDLSLYAWDAQKNALIGGWPGEKLSETLSVNGNTYSVYDFKDITSVPIGLIINGKATKTGTTKVLVQTSDITKNLSGDKYYRLSIRENYYKEVDPNDLKTFGFRIFVYIQKGDSHIDPYLHIWDTPGIQNTDWNSQLKMTEKWEYPISGGKLFYYYEPPQEAQPNMNFIVTLNKGQKKTGDVKGALKKDYYVCAWADSKSSFDLYNAGKDNPEDCK